MAKSAINRQVVRALQGFLAFEALAYAAAAAMHLAAVGPMEFDAWAGGAETLIAAVLVAGFIGVGSRPDRAIRCAIQAQLFALVVTLVGMFIVVATLTAQTVPTLVFHISVTAIVVAGIVYALTNRGARNVV